MDKMNDSKAIDARTIRSKRDLATAMLDLLQEKNLDDISVQEITDKALVSKATFYNHFNDKTELLTYVLEGYADELLEKIEPLIQDDHSINPRLLFWKAITIVVDFLVEEALPFRKMIENDKSKTLFWSLNSLIEGVFTKIVNKYNKFVKSDIDIDFAIYYYAGAYANLIYKKIGNSKDKIVDKDKIIKEIYTLSAPGIRD